MDNYIKRSNAVNAIDEALKRVFVTLIGTDIMRNVPAEDVAPVVHGKWIRLDMHRGLEQYKCSVCRSECYVPECMGEPMYEYCPNCGARMDGEDDG